MLRHFRRLLTAIFLTVLSIILLLSAGLGCLIVTPWGGRILIHYFKQQFAAVGLMHVGHYEGNLYNGFILTDMRVRGLSYLPEGLLRIQQVRVRLPWWDLAHPDVDIFNARLFMPECDPVVFTGHVHGGNIKGDLYAKSVNLHVVSRFWPDDDIRKILRGYVTGIDFKLEGPLSFPSVSGTFVADEVRYKSVILTDGFSQVNLTLFLGSNLQMQGELLMDSGLINVRNTNLKLEPSKLIFQGDVLNPMMDIHLGSKVQDTRIHLAIKGHRDYSQLSVSSDPPMPPQDALELLFLGNNWSASTSPFNGITSTELAQNFLSYSLQDVGEGQQFGLKRRLTSNLKLGVEMEQRPLQPGQTSVYYSRKVNGELDLSEHMSLNVSQQVFPQEGAAPASYQDANPQPETKFYLQYKKRF